MMVVSFDKVHQEVARYYKVEEDYIFKNTRKLDVVKMRQIFHYLAHVLNPRATLAAIGVYGGNKDHATVIHSIKIVLGLLDVDKVYQREVRDLLIILKNLEEKVETKTFSKLKYELMSNISETRNLEDLKMLLEKEKLLYENLKL